MTTELEERIRGALDRAAESISTPTDPHFSHPTPAGVPRARWAGVAAAVVVMAGAGGLIALRASSRSPERSQSTAPAAEPSTVNENLVGVDRAKDAAVVQAQFASVLEKLTASDEYLAVTWDAREALIAECMEAAGYEFRTRPNEAADETAAAGWVAWDAWFQEQLDHDPSFETTLFGGEQISTNVGGCQLTAYQQVHGPGEEGYSKLANLYNDVLALEFSVLEAVSTGTRSNLSAAASSAAERWEIENRDEVARIAKEMNEEADAARAILDQVDDS